MNVLELYNELKTACKNGVLTITDKTAGGAYCDLLCTLKDGSELKLTGCGVAMAADSVTVSGGCEILPYTLIGGGSMEIYSRIKDGAVYYDAEIKIAGEGLLSAFFSGLIPEDNVFKNFVISYPKLTFSKNETNTSNLISVSGNSKMQSGGEWDIYNIFVSDMMTFQGAIIRGFGTYVNLDFNTNQSYTLPFGTAKITLAMRTQEESTGFSRKHTVKAYLIMNTYMDDIKEDMIFQIPLFIGSDELQMAAFFSPVFSAGKFAGFITSGLNINLDDLLLPDDIYFSSFGLSYLEFTFKKKGRDFSDGLSLKQVSTNFSLDKPWNMPIPKLTLEKFTMLWEFSWWGDEKEALVSLNAYAKASLAIGKYKLTGEIKGLFPQMYFEGGLTLSGSGMSFGDLAKTLNSPLPDSWRGGEHILAKFNVKSSVPERSVSLTALLNDVLSVDIGKWTLSVDNIMIEAAFAPAANTFAFGGVISFGTDNDRFGFELNAAYNNGWTFSGNLAYGTVKIGSLLREMFGVEGDISGSGVEIRDFSISYSVRDGQFRLFASFVDKPWFKIFGKDLNAGGRIRLQKNKSDGLIASAAMYMEIDIFKLLVQADDFYRDTRELLFRVGVGDKYLQCIYSKNEDKEELLSVSLGGVTLGDIVNELIHLINPNAKAHLDAPWNVINEISLSAFSLIINATRKSAEFMYHVGLSIPGLMEISDVGIKCENKRINYVVKGKFLDKKEITWDAVDGAPPSVTAGGQKTRVSYLGIGAHLDVKIDGSDLETILRNMKNAIHSGENAPDVKYSESAKWIIGTDLTLGDLFRLQLLLYDPVLYGGKITVDVTDKSPLFALNGLEVELMYQKMSDSVGMLRCSFVPPKKMARFSIGVITVTLGKISVEIYTNGSFLIDIGFPHNHNFSHSFGIEFGIYTGSGGIYFGALKGGAVKNVPQTSKGTFSPVIMIGIGLKIGLGRSFDLGIVKGGVSLTVGGIFEGIFAVFHPTAADRSDAFYYRVNAMAEIAGTLFLSVDLCVITISASASVSAACDLTIESYRESEIAMELSLRLSASIKIIFFKISFSFDFHQRVSFTFGKNSAAPWDELTNTDKSMALTGAEEPLFPVKKIGDWNIGVSISPLLSQKTPDADTPAFCITFLSLVNNNDFSAVVNMLLNWLLSTAGDSVSYPFVSGIDGSAADSISLDTLEAFFKENLIVTIKPKTESGENEIDGIVFPMPHRLTLEWNGVSADYSQNPVTNEYLDEISEYFKHLNADPFHEIQKAAVSNGSMPFCGAIMLDYFRMILSELIARLKRLFGGFTVKTADVKVEAEKYGVSIEQLLTDNPGLVFNVELLPEHLHTISDKDTLSGIAGQYGISADALWESVKELPLIIAPSAQVSIAKYEFDNSKVKLTAFDAAAMFFVRLYDPDIIYLPYANKFIEDNKLPYDWECQKPYESDIKIGDKLRKSLAGDTVVRIAKAAAIADGGLDNDEWKDFLNEFLKNNEAQAGDIKDSYYISGTSGTDCDNTPNSLAVRLFPDLVGMSDKNPLWNVPFLYPLKQITLKNTAYNKTVKAADIDIAELAGAVANGKASLNEASTVKITSPAAMPKKEVIENIITDKGANEIGAMISRFFLQGLCPPSPADSAPTPLYVLLRQQFDLTDTQNDITITLSNSGTECQWLKISADPVVFTKESINAELPKGSLAKPAVPAVCPYFTETGKYWSIGDKQTVKLKEETTMLLSLPADLQRYLGQCRNTPVLYCDGSKTDDIVWSCSMEIKLVRKSRNIYSVIGASANDRLLLHELRNYTIENIRLLYRPSKLLGGSIELLEAEFGRCVIIRSNLSLQTHIQYMGGKVSDATDGCKHSADISDKNSFIRMLWECSTVGGGFLLYIDKDCLPDHLFDGEGVGAVSALITLKDCTGGRNAVNSVMIKKNAQNAAFYGDEEKVWVANSPVGCANLQTRIKPDGTKLSELFQVMSYSAKIGDKMIESAPILPQTANNADQSEDPERIYPVTVPLYRLSGDGISPYSAVGKTIPLAFYLNDVLGAAAEVGKVDVTGEYNDFLVRINELPYTHAVYRIEKNNNVPMLTIELRFCSCEDDKDAARSCAERAMYQAMCEDIELSAITTLDNTVRVLDKNKLSEYRAYTKSLYNWITGGDEPSDLIVSFPIDMSRLSGKIFEITASFTITRKACACDYDDVKSVVSVLSPDSGPDFADSFNNAFDQLKLAYDSNHKLYAVPMGEFIKKIQISPYHCNNIATPKMYAVKPYSTSLITRKCDMTLYDGTKTTAAYVDCDLQAWVNRFFDDLQMFTSSEIACRAARECPAELDRMIDAKKSIAENAAARIIPLSADFGSDELDAVRKEAKDCFLYSLDLVYNIDVFLAYKLDFDASERCRMETLLNGSADLRAQKIASDSDVFCLYSVADMKKRTETTGMSVSLLHMEHNISADESGYESSEWLRFDKPLESGGIFTADLSAEAGIAHPRNLYPSAPKIEAQSCSVNDSSPLRWDYDAAISCKAYEQHTVYLSLVFDDEPAADLFGMPKDIFDILADYDCKRRDILEKLNSGSSDGFIKAYTTAAQTAMEFAAPDTELKTAYINTASKGQTNRITLKINFTLGNKTEFTIVPNDEESEETLKRLGAKIEPVELISGGTVGEDITFRIQLSSLPVYSCRQVKPYAWIVQNEDLFKDNTFRIDNAFVFRTEEISLNAMNVTIRCTEPFKFDGIADIVSALQKLWDFMELSDMGTNTVSISVSYLYSVSSKDPELCVCMPVTFIPEAVSPEAAADNISAWAKQAHIIRDDPKLLFEVSIFGGSQCLVETQIQMSLNNI